PVQGEGQTPKAAARRIGPSPCPVKQNPFSGQRRDSANRPAIHERPPAIASRSVRSMSYSAPSLSGPVIKELVRLRGVASRPEDGSKPLFCLIQKVNDLTR